MALQQTSDGGAISDADLIDSPSRRSSLGAVAMTPGDVISMETTDMARAGDARPRRQHGKCSCFVAFYVLLSVAKYLKPSACSLKTIEKFSNKIGKFVLLIPYSPSQTGAQTDSQQIERT